MTAVITAVFRSTALVKLHRVLYSSMFVYTHCVCTLLTYCCHTLTITAVAASSIAQQCAVVYMRMHSAAIKSAVMIAIIKTACCR
jgi:hypothetical protein